MNSTTAGYEVLISRVSEWAEREEGIHAVFVFGSQARRDNPADEWSDLDLLLLADEPQFYIETVDWLQQIGEQWVSFLERTPDGGFERRVLFEGGFDVDFIPESVDSFRKILAEGLPTILEDIFRRGFRILVDKDGLAARITAVKRETAVPAPDSEAEYLAITNDFWYHTVWTAKHLRRGELWWAKSCCDSYLKKLLLSMLERHARAARGKEFDTWMRGRFLEEWADPRAVAALPQIFAHYDEPDVWRALLATMDLFRWLAVETAEYLGYAYPSSGDEHCTNLVQQLSLTG